MSGEMIVNLVMVFIFSALFARGKRKHCINLFLYIFIWVVISVVWRYITGRGEFIETIMLEFSHRTRGTMRVFYILMVSSLMALIYITIRDFLATKKNVHLNDDVVFKDKINLERKPKK